MSTKVKICGITNVDDAVFSAECGADALGFIFYEKSARNIDTLTARGIIKRLPPLLTTVGVFVGENISTVKEVVEDTGIDVVQLHGGESVEYLIELERLLPNTKFIKVLRIGEGRGLEGAEEFDVSAFLLDTFAKDLRGGTGKVFDWEIAREAARLGRIILSGGLNPENVIEAVKSVNPYAVDVSSGVEAEPGIKDHDKVENFIDRIKKI